MALLPARVRLAKVVGMGTVSLHALGIDELRDLGSGTAESVARLRAIAVETWPPRPVPSPREGGLLAKLGPISRRPVGAPVVTEDVPTGRDLDDIAHGRDVPPQRRAAAWALVDAFVAATAWDSLHVAADDHSIDALDFALASAGVPSRLGLRQLFRGDTALGVKLLPGMADGYVRGTGAVAMASAWRGALGSLPAEVTDLATTITRWLDGFPDLIRKADEAGRPAPDLVAWYRP